MEITSTTTLEELCFIVGDALIRRETGAVLTGGSAATIYAGGAYQSRDADFVLRFGGLVGIAHEVLLGLGFTGRLGQYSHPQSDFTVDLPPGPLGVGCDYITSWDVMEAKGCKLNILTPTDSVRDRLAQYYAWDDASGLTVAVAVARTQRDRIDLASIAAWTKREERNVYARQGASSTTFFDSWNLRNEFIRGSPRALRRVTAP